MTRHFWNIHSRLGSVEVLHKIELLTRRFGFIVDYKKFAADYYIIEIEVENTKTEGFFHEISSAFSVEKYNEIALNVEGDDVVFLNVKVI